MKFIDFKQHFEPFRVFSTIDIMKWDPGFDTRRLVEWQDKKYVVKIINRWYCFPEVIEEERFLHLIANRIYGPSYVSFESALSFYNMIPEGVYTTTSATSLKTKLFTTQAGIYSYRHIRPDLMFGYKLIEVQGQYVKIAEPEKVLLDYLYLNTSLTDRDDFESTRINDAACRQQIDNSKLIDYLSLFKNKALEKRVSGFLKIIVHA